MKKIYSFITSMPFMAFLLLTVGFTMAIATFVESSQGTPTARALIYDRHWFELIWFLLALNLINNLIRYNFFTKRRFVLAIFHISFIVILIGAAVTRYISYEGVMHIRENQSSNSIVSSDDYFYAAWGNQQKEKKVKYSEFAPKQFSSKFEVGGQKVTVKSVGFISDAESKPVPSESGEAIIDFVYSTPGTQGMQAFPLKKGYVLQEPGFTVGFESNQNTAVKFLMKGQDLFLVSSLPIKETTMASQETVTFPAGDTIPVKVMFLYGFESYQFLLRNFLPSATLMAAKGQNETGRDAVIVEISDGINKQTVPVFGHSGIVADTINVPVGGGQLKLAYGSPTHTIPFSIFLKDFQLERYPGSNSPSSYASEVVLQDFNSGLQKDYRIFMNNTLTYKGFKFFQSSYDTDERGTILSVNHDLWGTRITYLGYFLLILGIVLALVNKNSYFQYLARKLKQSSVKSIVLLVFAGGLSFSTSAQGTAGAAIPDIHDQLVKDFSELWVQGADGRIEPVSTLSSEIVRKISRKSSLYEKTSDEVVLSMMVYPEIWQTMPIILVSDKSIANQLGVNEKYLAIQNFFDAQGNYKISENVRAAYGKGPAFRSKMEKEYINLDERVNICFMVFQTSMFKLFPRKAQEDSWYSPGIDTKEYTGGDSLFIKSGFQMLLQSIASQQNADASQVLGAIGNFQQKYGGDIIPSQSKKEIEIVYNQFNPFKRIFPYYLMFGLLLMFVLIANIFRQKPLPKLLRISFFGIIFIAFLIHTAGLIIRWYISGHAPWSNGFESVVYVAWATMLAGFIFGRKYPMVVGTAAFLSGIALFVAHLSWMNPEVTNLVPVLKSYWLAIHVAIITASYGFLGLSTILGVMGLILIVLRTNTNKEKVTDYIEQLTTINEMSATVGLYFLTVGTFLGGVWANESWGRYWGWDPKETWALITVVIYSFIVHMRLIPPLRGVFNYTVASIIGFASVLMTYFGVNYYLSGLHSYGKGVADGVHPAVPVSVALLAGLIIWAYFKDSKYEKENNVE